MTPFGDLDFKNLGGIEPWVAAHDQRHRTYRNRAGFLGASLQIAPLASMPEADWFGRHLLTHIALNHFIIPDNSYVILSLDVARWNSEPGFHDWHNTHNLIHHRLDNAFGIQ